MKKAKRILALLLSAIMCVMIAAPAISARESTTDEAEKPEYLYENKYLWNIPTESFTWDAYYSLYDHHKGMGKNAYDGTEYSIDDIVNSPLGEGMVENIENFLIYPDQDDPHTYEIWEEAGIDRVFHDLDDPDRQWVSYMPKSMNDPENADKKYPVLFVFHGNNNPIYFIESWGYAQLSAKEDVIVIAPWAKNGGKGTGAEDGVFLTEEVDRIIKYLKDNNYPIDESRFYATGFSLGGRSTVNQLMKHPNMFAAIGVGGQHTYGVDIDESEWAQLKETPMMFMAGTCDRNSHFPYGQKNEKVVTALNKWFTLNGVDASFTNEQCLDIANNSENLAERKLGLIGDETYIQYYDGTEYYTADWFNEDGINMVKGVAIEGMPHWLTGSFATLMWNFMKQYARDTETGELIVLNQDNEPQLEPQEIEYKKEGTFISDFTTETVKGGIVTINLKASEDIEDFYILTDDGELLDLFSKERNLGEDGYYSWTLKATISQVGRVILNLTPISSKYGEKKTLKMPVKVENKTYDYEKKYLWYVDSENFSGYWEGVNNAAQKVNMGIPGVFDMEEFIDSPMGEAVIERLENYVLYDDQMDPAVVKYWEDKGIKKEVRDADDEDRYWAVYTPLSAFEEENKNKEYPVLFVFHGSTDIPYITESYGFVDIAAKEDFIVVIPWAQNGGKDDHSFLDNEMDRIMGILREEYPIDESRIYATGFSLGGRSTVLQTLYTPDRFAAIGVGGQHLAGQNNASGFEADAEKWDNLLETPLITMAGTMDRNYHFPYGQKNALQIDAANKWLNINGIDKVLTQEECKEISATSTNLVERKLGMTADEEYIQYYNSTAFYTGDFFNDDGINMMKFVAIEGVPHWASGQFAQIVWDFLKQYARDKETGEIIVLSQTETHETTPQVPEYGRNGAFISEYTRETITNGEIKITLKATEDIKGFFLKNEDGKSISIVSAEKTLRDDGCYDWTITTKVGTPGERILSLIPVSSIDGVKDALKLRVTVTERENAYDVIDFSFDTKAVIVNENFNAKVETGRRVNTIAIRNEKGSNMGKTLISKSITDEAITWNYQLKIGSAGINRELTAYARNAEGIYDSSKSATITVVK